MAEIIGVAASIATLLHVANKVAKLLGDVKSISKDEELCRISIYNVQYQMSVLQLRIDESNPNEPWTREVKKLNEPKGALKQCESVLEELAEKIGERRGFDKVMQKLAATKNKQEIASILSRMEQITSHIQSVLSKDQFDLSKAIKHSVDDLSLLVKEEAASRRDSEQEKKHKEVVDWISPSDFPAKQSDVISGRQVGTGEWFLKSPEFNHWLNNPNQTLFCPGIPGAGKTIISAIAIDHLLNDFSSEDVGIAYVYCNYKSQDEQTVPFLMAGILKQLVRARSFTPKPALDLYEKCSRSSTRPKDTEVVGVIEAVLKTLSNTFIVVDALDECAGNGRRSDLLTSLERLQHCSNLSLMFTSRMMPELREWFSGSPMLEVRANYEDVKRYLAGQLHRLARIVQKNEQLKDHVKECIARVVEGMFLLARLHMDSLQDKDTIKAIKLALKILPQKSYTSDLVNAVYNEAYKDALERIKTQSDNKRERAFNALTWIVLAKRPLLAEDLCYALAIGLEDEEFDMDDVPDIEDVISTCAGLVILDPEGGIVKLVHYTTQDYLESTLDSWNSHGRANVALSCAKFLMFTWPSQFKLEEKYVLPVPDEIFFRRHVPYAPTLPFLDYARTSWPRHFSNVNIDEVRGFVRTALSHTVLPALLHVALAPREYTAIKSPFNGLHIASRFNLLHIATEILAFLGSEVGRSHILAHSLLGNPLEIAVEHGHMELVELFISHLGPCQDRPQVHTRALLLACYRPTNYLDCNGNPLDDAGLLAKQLKLVRTLLDAGAVVDNSPVSVSNMSVRLRHCRGTLFQSACRHSSVEIIQILLDAGADVDSKCLKDIVSPLTYAYGEYDDMDDADSTDNARSTQVVETLLRAGASLMSSNDDPQLNQLRAASAKGYLNVVQMLLDSGMDIDAHEGCALIEACQTGKVDSVELLLRRGANLTSQSGLALQMACTDFRWPGKEKVVQLLLTHNAKLEKQDRFEQRSLVEAVEKLSIDTNKARALRRIMTRLILNHANEQGYDLPESLVTGAQLFLTG